MQIHADTSMREKILRKLDQRLFLYCNLMKPTLLVKKTKHTHKLRYLIAMITKLFLHAKFNSKYQFIFGITFYSFTLYTYTSCKVDDGVWGKIFLWIVHLLCFSFPWFENNFVSIYCWRKWNTIYKMIFITMQVYYHRWSCHASLSLVMFLRIHCCVDFLPTSTCR